jgi:predicted  nucleic acid-binding Zn-ribbon protein
MTYARLFAALAWLACCAGAAAAETVPPTLEALDLDLDDLAFRIREVRGDLDDLVRRIDHIERRLGDTYETITPFNTFEKRIEDLEKEVERLQRR